MCTCIQPGKATLQGLHLQFLLCQILLVNGGNLQLTTSRWLDVLGNLNHAVGVEIKTYHGVVRLGVLGLLLNAQAVTLGIKLSHTVALGVVHVVTEHGSLIALLGILNTLLQQACKARTVEDVIAQHQAGAVVANKLLAYDKCLCQSIG